MERSSHAPRALALLHKQGFLRTRDLDTIGALRVVLTRLFSSGQLERVGRDLYRLPGNPMSEHEDLATIAVKVPKAVFCLLTALQFHELTTQLPRQVWIAMPRGSHTPRIWRRFRMRDHAALIRACWASRSVHSDRDVVVSERLE